MKLEIIFDDEKLKKEGYTKEQCLNVIRDFLSKFKSDSIKEIEPGVFIGDEKEGDEAWVAFGSITAFPYQTDWFLKVIKNWYWYVDEGDGKGEQKEDGLKTYYEVEELNNNKNKRRRRKVEESIKF